MGLLLLLVFLFILFFLRAAVFSHAVRRVRQIDAENKAGFCVWPKD